MMKQFAITFIDGTTQIMSSGSLKLLMLSLMGQYLDEEVIKIEELEFWKRDDYVGD